MTVAQVRVIISDPRQFHRDDTVLGDGVQRQFILRNAPMVTGTLTVIVDEVEIASSEYTVDDSLALVTFDTAPIAGAQIVCTYQSTLLSDADIQTFLDLNGGSVLRGAAAAIDTIASSEALIAKRTDLLDIKLDGPAVARALREHAKALRAQAEDEEEEAEGSQDGMIDYAEHALPPFGSRSRFWNERWRNWDG